MANVTFDGPNKLIIVNNGITSLDVQVDLYSDWKEWVLLSDNSKYLPAFAATGGEPIGGGLYTGQTYIVINGWYIRPYEANHNLFLDGNIFGDAGAPIITPTLGGYTVTVQFRNSTQAQGISTSGGDPTTIAVAVWAANRAANNGAGTFGETNQNAPLSVVETEDAVWDGTAADHLGVGTTGLTLSQAKAAAETAALESTTTHSLIDVLVKYENNRTKIDKTAKTLTIYDDDGITPIKVYNLKNAAGVPSTDEVTERIPV